MTPFAEVPDMQAVSVLATQQQLGIQAVLDHVRRAPFAGDRDVVSQMPGEIVAEILRAAVDFPPAQRLEGVVIQGEDSSGTVTARRAQRAHVDAVGTAM